MVCALHVMTCCLAMSGRPPPNIDGMTSLKIDNLSYRTDSESLRRKFEKYGDIGDVYVPKDKYGESRGFAFVRFYDKVLSIRRFRFSLPILYSVMPRMQSTEWMARSLMDGIYELILPATTDLNHVSLATQV